MDLYYMPSCPHCHRVIGWIRENDASEFFTFYDVTASDDAARQLERVEGGDGYVPCLDDDGRVIIGDNPIIAYLEEKGLGV